MYCHFWKGQGFTVTVGGAKKTVLTAKPSVVKGADNAKCTAHGESFSVHHQGFI